MLQFLLKRIFIILVLVSSSVTYSQQIIDSCFTSTSTGTGFPASTNLTSLNGDLMQWNGSSWSGGWAGANITIAPPAGGSGCRAIWCGSGTVWTTGGEGFGMRLNGPLVAGQTYTYNFTTVSHGTGSNGSFSPMVYTNTSGSVGGVLVGNLTPAGNTWVTNAFTFTATAAQAGHTWIIIFTGSAGSSGFVNNFCTPCNIPQITNCNVDLGPDLNLCPGQTTTLNATTPGATYLWSNNSTGPTLTVSQAGTYTVAINVNGCTDTDAVTVTYGVNPTVNLGPDVTFCSPQTLNLNATFPNSTYLWQNGSTAPTFAVTQSGTYSVSVTNSCGTATDNIVVNYITPTVNLGPDLTLCPGQTTTLNATTPGATYLWSDNSTGPTLLVNQAGTYSVTTTVSGCTATDAVSVTSGVNPTVNLGPDVTFCSPQTLNLNATFPNSTYLWQNGSTASTFAVTQSGTYSVSVTNGCGTATDNIVVNYITPSVNLGPDLILCPGQTTTLNATTPGATYLWSDNSTGPTLLVNQAGTYSVTTTVSGCTATDAVTITSGVNPMVNLGPDITLCSPQTLSLDATFPNSTYLWQDNSTAPTIIVTQSGTYSVSVTNNCGTITDDILVTINSAPVFDLGPDITVCTGQTVDLDATSPNATYLWQDNSTNPIFTVTQAGNYSVIASVGNCSSTDDIDITFVTTPLLNLGNDTILCEGQALILNATMAGATYLWQDNSTGPTLNVSQSGIYSVDLISSCGTISDAIQVDFIPLPIINLGNDTAFCQGGTVLLDATNTNCTYLWQDNSISSTYSVSQSGTYSVIASNSLACTSSDLIIVVVNPIPTVSAGGDLSLCQGNLITLSGTGANTYSWNNGITNGTPFSPPIGTTTYTVTGTTSAGCTNTDDVTVVVGNVPTITFTADVTEGCTPLTVNLTNTTPGASNCVWTLSDGTIITGCGTIPVIFEQEGCFDVTLTAELSSGCYGSTTQVDYICVENPPQASFISVPQQTTAFNPTIYFNNTSIGASAYTWDFGDSSQLSTLINPEHQYPFGIANSYPVMLIATTPFGCSDTAYSYIQVLEELIYYIPNSFTPDGDIFNQTFQPVFTSGFDPFNYNLRIFNRWGEVIFESADPATGWDGSYTLNGNVLPCQSGVYTWKIEFKSPENDEKKVINGHVSLLR